MDAPVYKKLVDLDNHFENQSGSNTGHLPVSVTETFWARLGRYGRPKGTHSSVSTIADTTGITYAMNLQPSIGCIFYPKKVIASANVSGVAVIMIKSNIPQGNNPGAGMQDPIVFYKRVQANQGLDLDFDGEIYCLEGGIVSIGFWPDTAGKFSGTAYGLEVMPDA